LNIDSQGLYCQGSRAATGGGSKFNSSRFNGRIPAPDVERPYRFVDLGSPRHYDKFMSNQATTTGEIHPDSVGVKLTDAAVQQIKRLIARDKREGQGLRISISDGGCSGFSYKLDFDKQQRAGDTVLRFDDINVYVDQHSLGYLKGTVVDFESGLYGGGFKFSNPNATATCGCGTSFSA
jgi:iron-sulfur cluster assembly protein